MKTARQEAPTSNHTMKWRDVPRIFAYRNCTLSYIANVLVMVGFWGVVSFGTTYWVNEGGLTLAAGRLHDLNFRALSVWDGRL